MVLRGMHDTDSSGTMSMENALHYTFLLNQAFARIYVVLGAIAIALWSWAILGQSAWMIWAAAALWRGSEGPAD